MSKQRPLPFLITVLAALLVPVAAWARPPGPAHGASVAAALYGGIGGPVCLAASSMVLGCVAASVWSSRRGWRLAAGAGGALSVGLALTLARMSGGHDASTEIALAAGVVGLIVPALQAVLAMGPEIER